VLVFVRVCLHLQMRWKRHICFNLTSTMTFHTTLETKRFNVDDTTTYSSFGWCGGHAVTSDLKLRLTTWWICRGYCKSLFAIYFPLSYHYVQSFNIILTNLTKCQARKSKHKNSP